RTVLLDFPLGCPAGKPNDPELQRAVLRAAFAAASTFGESWEMVELPLQWAADGSRAWEDQVRQAYRAGLAAVAARGAPHRAGGGAEGGGEGGVGERLHGEEKESAIRCNC